MSLFSWPLDPYVPSFSTYGKTFDSSFEPLDLRFLSDSTFSGLGDIDLSTRLAISGLSDDGLPIQDATHFTLNYIPYIVTGETNFEELLSSRNEDKGQAVVHVISDDIELLRLHYDLETTLTSEELGNALNTMLRRVWKNGFYDNRTIYSDETKTIAFSKTTLSADLHLHI